MNAKTFAEFVKNKRNELGLTQADLAQLIGVTRQSISFWETSPSVDKFMKVSSLIALEKALRIPAGELFKAYYS